MKRFVSLILILLVGFQIFSQTKLDFDQLSMKDGFSSGSANVFLQDQKGFMWVGTWNGLNKYDGYKCKVYTPKYHDSTTISNREVTELIEDHQGNIWIGTSSGLNCLDPRTDKIRRYEIPNRINTICEDNNHIIWVGTGNGGLFRVDPKLGEIEHYLNSETISDILEDSRNNLWIASHNGLLNFNRETGGFIRYLSTSKPNSISGNVAFSLAESKDGSLWVGTWGSGLNKVIQHPNQDSVQFLHYHYTDRIGSLSSEVVHKLYYDQYDNLWLGTWAGGLNLLRSSEQTKAPEKANFEVFQNNINDSYSLSNNTITAIYVDKKGELWVGADYINRTSIIDIGINRYKFEQLNGQMLNISNVRQMAKIDDKIVATTGSEIVIFEDVQGRLRPINHISNLSYNYNGTIFYSRNILSIEATQNLVLVGTEGAGLILIDKQAFLTNPNPCFEFINTATKPALPDVRVKVVRQSKESDQQFWLGMMHDSFLKLTISSKGNEVKVYEAGERANQISDKNIRDIEVDAEGMVWIGTQKGLNYFNPKIEEFQKFYYNINDSNSINDNVINSIFKDSSSSIWIGTNGGLNKAQIEHKPYGEKSIYFKAYPSINNLSDEIVQNIVEDSNHNLWIGLYKGLSLFDPKDEIIIKDYFFKEFYNVGILPNSEVLDSYGYLIIGGGNGIVSFHPDSLLKNSIAPRVSITDVKILNKSISLIKGRTQKTVPYIDELTFNHNDKTLTFEFAALDFKNPDENTYSYLLEGYDKQWNNVGSRNNATYTSLPAGAYTLKVSAVNSDGKWSSESAILKIKVKRPWWKTYVAYVIYVIIIIGLLYFFKEYSIVQVKEKSEILLEKVKNEEHEKLHELKAQFFTDVTHEFRTPLTLILGPAKELSDMNNLPEYATKQASLIQRNAEKMLRLINQLMEYRKVAKGKMELYLQKCDLKKIITETYESFKSMSESKNIYLKLDIRQNEIISVVDIDKFEKIVYNLVSNAFKYSEDGGQISIMVDLQKGADHSNIILEVQDSGIGIAPEHIDKIFNRFYQVNLSSTQSTGGIGLYITKQFVEQHGGTIEVESELGKGSIFKVSIPAGGAQIVAENDQMIENVVEAELDVAANSKDSKATVLVVEDDHDMNEFVVTGLGPNFTVYNAYDGQQGLEIARKINPDIIISDIMMPEMDGFELVKALQKDMTTSHIPVVFLTAKTMQEDEIKGLKIGAVDYIFKPFNLISLRLKIQNILENRRTVHERYRTEQILEPETIKLSSLDEKFLKDAVESVNKNLDDPNFDVEKFSKEIGISANQAYRKIKALTGQTAKEFIRNQRLKTAASLFLQKKRSISEIIYMVGFSSPSYFTRCFKEYYGCTPKDYIDKNGII